MRKLYCDRCKKEVEELFIIKKPYKVSDYAGCITKDVEVCKSCETFIKKAEKEYNNSMAKVRVAFYETLFPNQVDIEG